MSVKTRTSTGKGPVVNKSKAPKNHKNAGKVETKTVEKVTCVECDKIIAGVDQALFVEEEVGRYFCSEPCIVTHFTSEITKLEREYGKHVSANDLNSEERERYAHLRWMTLEKPEEIWCDKMKSGDSRYTLISEFTPDQKSVWAVAICLMLRNEPSFLYLAFVTSDRHLVEVFRRGDQLQMSAKPRSESTETPLETETQDRLAEPWTEGDSVRAGLLKARKHSDIPVEDFGFYQKCLEETLQNPNELWSYQPPTAKRIYHFLKQYSHDEAFWYVVIAKDTIDETQIEIIDVFPTRDQDLIDLCRHGKKEILGTAEAASKAETELPESVRRNVH